MKETLAIGVDRFLSNAYLRGMQTTLRLPDDLYKEAKARAAQDGISLTQLLMEAIKMRLGRSPVDQTWVIPTSSVHAGLSQDETMAFVDAAMKEMELEDSAALVKAVRGK